MGQTNQALQGLRGCMWCPVRLPPGSLCSAHLQWNGQARFENHGSVMPVAWSRSGTGLNSASRRGLRPCLLLKQCVRLD